MSPELFSSRLSTSQLSSFQFCSTSPFYAARLNSVLLTALHQLFSCQVIPSQLTPLFLRFHSSSQLFSAPRNSCQLILCLLISSPLFSHLLSSSHILSADLSSYQLFPPHLSSSQHTLRSSQLSPKPTALPTKYHFVLQDSQKILPSTTCTTKLEQSTSTLLLCVTKVAQALPSTTLHYKTRKKYFPVRLVLRSWNKIHPPYYFALRRLHKHFPVGLCTTNLHRHFPALLCTTKLAQNTSQYFFVQGSLHKTFPCTTCYYKGCTKHFPVLFCTAKFAPALPGTTLFYKICTADFPALLCP